MIMRDRGFTLIEVLIVVAVLGVAVLVGLPALEKFIGRSKLEGTSQQTAMVMYRARQEAIRFGVPVVVKPDYINREVLAFADLDDNGVYSPDSAQPLRTVDYELARVPLPSKGIYFMGPSRIPGRKNDPGDSISGFDSSGGVAVFEPDGSVRDDGAIRIGDKFGNLLEVRLASRATGKVEVQKYNHEPPGGLAPGYYPRATAGEDPLWVWYWDWEYSSDPDTQATDPDPDQPASGDPPN